MSVDKELLMEQFEDLKGTLLKVLEKASADAEEHSRETEELRASKREAEEKAWAAEEKATNTEAELEKTKSELTDVKDELQSKTDELEALKSDSSKDDEIATIKKERDELQAEMDEITGKLERVSELYREVSDEKDKLQEKVDVSDLLAIYIVLIENIFGGKPHARVLYTLHNTKSAITRKNLEASTGIMPTAVLKAVHDLRNADLISFDEDSQEVKLIKEIM
ncbi:MAG: hypothetical protein ACFE7R_10765 [Candidatus Hodarchaeota archaeon]